METYDLRSIEEKLFHLYKDAKVVMYGHFFLASGRHSNIYINKDVIYRSPKPFKTTVEALASYTGAFSYDIITGPAIAGAVLAAPVAIAMNKVFVYPEKVEIGTKEVPVQKMVFRRGYDKVIPGMRVLIIEDVITTGGSVQMTMDAVLKLGGFVAGVLVIWNRQGWKPKNCNIISLINQRAESWTTLVHGEYYQEGEHCPLCREGMPLQDPKSL